MRRYIKLIPVILTMIIVFSLGLYKSEKKFDIDINIDANTELKNTIQEEEESLVEGTDDTSLSEDAMEEYDTFSGYDAFHEKEKEQAAEKNIYEMSEGYISYGGLGYKVRYVKMFETSEEFMNSEYYESLKPECEYHKTLPEQPDTLTNPESQRYLYFELEVTNESETSKYSYNPADLHVYFVNERGYTYDDNDEAMPYIFGGCIWFNDVENPMNYKNHQAPRIEPEETVLIKVLYKCIYSTKYESSDAIDGYLKPWDELYDGEWYLGIPGTYIVMNYDFNIYENKNLIFVKLDVDNFK